MIHIEHFTFNAFQERAFVVWDNDGYCVFVDPGFSTDAERNSLTDFVSKKGLKPVCIMLTHAHLDHIFGVAELARIYNIPVYMDEKEKYTLEVCNPFLCRAFGLPMPESFEPIALSSLAGADAAPCVQVGSLNFEVIETPGHSVGGVCFLERDEKVLFSGDTLFAGAIGRTDHPGGDYDLLMKSIFEQLMCLDGDIAVFPGHGPDTSIADERMTNPFLLPFNEPLDD